MRGSFSYAWVMGVVGVFCTGAWAVDTPILSVRLGGYTPNTYGTCRPTNGIFDGTGAPCTVSSDCVSAESCGQLFRDISCSVIGAVGDAECEAATGGPSKCEQINLPSGATPLRCSAISLAPSGMVGPGDTLFLEVFADEWDQTPTEGVCTNGVQTCTIGEVERCKSCRGLNENATPDACVDSTECTDGLLCRVDKHCERGGQQCFGIGSQQCVLGEACIPDTCDDFPTVATYQWTIDSTDFSNGNGPASRLILGGLPCTAATVLDDCRHAQPTGCESCSIATCDASGSCSSQADVFVSTPRLDFAFAGLSPTTGCSSATGDVTCGATIGASAPVADDGTHRYLGTTVVTVSDGACGAFRVGLINDPAKTFLQDSFGLLLPGLVTNFVTLNIGPKGVCDPRCVDDGDLCTADECNCSNLCVHPPIDLNCPAGEECIPSTGLCGVPSGCELLDMTSTPAHCSIDPGIPHEITSSVPPLGWQNIDLTFGTATGCDTSELTTADFSVAVTPSDVAVGVSGVVSTGTNTATVTLTKPIPAQHWVCLTHDGPAATGGPETTCLGALPADADATQESSAADIAAVIDCLVSATCEVWKCDIDRLDACTGADVEETVNLLNGAGAFDAWDMVTLPALPDCPAP